MEARGISSICSNGSNAKFDKIFIKNKDKISAFSLKMKKINCQRTHFKTIVKVSFFFNPGSKGNYIKIKLIISGLKEKPQKW